MAMARAGYDELSILSRSNILRRPPLGVPLASALPKSLSQVTEQPAFSPKWHQSGFQEGDFRCSINKLHLSPSQVVSLWGQCGRLSSRDDR